MLDDRLDGLCANSDRSVQVSKIQVWINAEIAQLDLDDESRMNLHMTKINLPLFQLLGDEVYHYHAKYLCKPPHTGGSFIWHQDYG